MTLFACAYTSESGILCMFEDTFLLGMVHIIISLTYFSDLFRVRSTADNLDCELSIVGNLDRETRTFWNVTLGVREVTRTKRQVNVDEYVQGQCE